MHLVVDASVLIEESFRVQGRRLLEHPSLKLVVAVETWSETVHERRRRLVIIAERGNLSAADAAVLSAKIAVHDTRIQIFPESAYADLLGDAEWRVPRDPHDACTVALALTLDCGIWTSDRDFFGCGLPVWSTDVLRRFVEVHPPEVTDDAAID